MAPATILSPHPDDAVLSLWHLLSAPREVSVLNVFGGRPPQGADAGWWDRLTGASDPARRMAERHAEDRAALGLAGRVPDDLGLLAGQYHYADRSAEEIATAIAERVPAAELLYAPAALDGHPSHHRVRAAALELAAGGRRVALYADIPHALVFGWPAWVSGGQPLPYLDADVFWRHQLRGTGIADPGDRAQVQPLTPEQRARKREAVLVYSTQVPALEAQFGSLEAWLAYEVVWPPGP